MQPKSEAAIERHRLVLELIPYMLSVSRFDGEGLDCMMGFDFAYRGSHDALVAEALGVPPSLDGLVDIPNSQVINFEPSITIALDDACRLQARLMVETRTNAYHVRRGDFPEDQISVYFTVRQYGSLPPGFSFEQTLDKLPDRNERLMGQ